MILWSILTLVGVAALLWCERIGSRAGVWMAKPAASTAFIAVALAAGATGTGYGRALLAGLILSWFGDVFLIPRGAPKLFLAGVGSFLLGHVAYAVAFVARGIDLGTTIVAAVAAVALAAVVLGWLRPHVGPDMRAAVPAYITVISVMVVSAAGTYALKGNGWIPLGAVGFYLSDISVARDRFVKEEFSNRLWGLPLYYTAQVMLGCSIYAERMLAAG